MTSKTRALDYWEDCARGVHRQFHVVLEKLTEISAEAASSTIYEMVTCTAPFVQRPDDMVGVYPAPVEGLVVTCYSLAFGFQSATKLMSNLSIARFKAIEASFPVPSSPLANAADGLFSRHLAQLCKGRRRWWATWR